MTVFYGIFTGTNNSLREHIDHLRDLLCYRCHISPSLLFVDIPTASNLHDMQDFNLPFHAVAVDNPVFPDPEPLPPVMISLHGLDVRIRMPKGKKATIQAHAEARSESVNGFINRAIQETMERDNDVPRARV